MKRATLTVVVFFLLVVTAPLAAQRLPAGNIQKNREFLRLFNATVALNKPSIHDFRKMRRYDSFVLPSGRWGYLSTGDDSIWNCLFKEQYVGSPNDVPVDSLADEQSNENAGFYHSPTIPAPTEIKWQAPSWFGPLLILIVLLGLFFDKMSEKRKFATIQDAGEPGVACDNPDIFFAGSTVLPEEYDFSPSTPGRPAVFELFLSEEKGFSGHAFVEPGFFFFYSNIKHRGCWHRAD